jgi:hypothetical protein
MNDTITASDPIKFKELARARWAAAAHDGELRESCGMPVGSAQKQPGSQ